MDEKNDKLEFIFSSVSKCTKKREDIYESYSVCGAMTGLSPTNIKSCMKTA